MRQPTPTERYEELTRPGALAALRAEREAAVVRWRTYLCGVSLHRSEPLHAELTDSRQPGRWLPDDEPVPRRAVRVGYDADGRVALARGWLRRGEDEHLIQHGDAVEELVVVSHLKRRDRATVGVRHLHLDASGRVVRVLDDEGTEELYRWDDAGRVIEQETRYDDGEPWTSRSRVVWDDGGEVERVEVQREDGGWHVAWRAALQRQEDELPPLTETLAGTAPALAAAYAAAIETAASELDDARVAVIRATDDVPAPGAVLGAVCIDGLRRRVRDPDGAIDRALVAAHDRDDAVRIDPVVHAGPELQRALRRYAQRVEWLRCTEEDTAWEERQAGVAAFARELREALALLNAPCGAPLLTVLWDEGRSWEATAVTAGADRVAQLRAELRPRSVAAERRPRELIRTKADLREALRAEGLERVADAIVADARIGIALPFGEGRSRLGGAPELPVGVDWPHVEGRALTPLAAIDCAELPDEVDDRDLLPADGTLLVFAALHEDEHGAPVLHDGPAEAGEGWLRVLHVPPGTETRAVEPPEDLLGRGEHELGLLNEQAVAPRAIVTLRDSLHAPARFGLGSGESEAYDAIYWDVSNEGREDVAGQLLGHPLPVQEDPREEGQELLFELAWNEPLGFEYLDGGSMHFLGTPADLRARRWDRLVAWSDSS